MNNFITDFDPANKTVIVRVDFNVPINNGIIDDDTRIRAALSTINYLLEKKAKIVLMSHLGKVKTAEDLQKKSLRPVGMCLQKLINHEVRFCSFIEGKEFEAAVDKLQPQEIILIENVRFADIINSDGTLNLESRRESQCDLLLSKYWASMGDYFINDAFATCHRSHASNVGIAQHIKHKALGFLVKEELDNLKRVKTKSVSPYIAILGGAKVSDKIKVLDELLKIASKVLIGGGMSYTFLRAKNYNIGTSLFEKESLEYAVAALKKYSHKIVLPVDYAITDKFDANAKISYCDADQIPDNMMGMDIGPKTEALFSGILQEAKTVFWNGPLGVFEFKQFSHGTQAILNTLAQQQTNDETFFSVIGGGDTASAAINLGFNKKDFGFISTGGGAALTFIAGEDLPGVSAIIA